MFLKVRLGFVCIYKQNETSATNDVATQASRPLIQHRKNPYSWRLFGEQNAWLGQPAGSLLGEKVPPGFFRKYKNPLFRCFLMKCCYYKEKLKSRFDRKIEIWLGIILSNPVFHRKPNIILWLWRTFLVERFALNKSQKFGFGCEPFLCQCKKSTQSRLFPKSILAQMTYRKLKPHASWHLLHAPFHLFHYFYWNLENKQIRQNPILFSNEIEAMTP